MLHYILQTIAFQLFFLIVYDLFLRKETFFNWNRAYLLITTILSFVLPFIKIEAFKNTVSSQFIINLPAVFIGQQVQEANTSILLNTITIQTNHVSYLELFFYLGFTIALSLFIIKLLGIYKLLQKNPKRWKGNFLIVNLIKSSLAFSFFSYVFIGDKIKKTEAKHIIEHEKIHVQQKHTLDLIFFEVLRIVFWFNPLIYIYQKRTATLHEFIADSKAVKHNNKTSYYENLLAQIFDTNSVSFINTFFKQSLIKKRIVMLTKQKSKSILKLKYALLIPVVLGMLLYTSCEKESVEKQESASILEQIEQLKTSIETSPNITEEERKKLAEIYINVLTSKLESKIEREPINKDYSDTSEVPFAVIDQVPVFPGCEGLPKVQQKKCMTNKISTFVVENFNATLGKAFGLTGKIKIYVGFKIDENGEVSYVKARAPHEALAEEAKRVINLLPKMIPGKQNGKAVTVPYSLPIIFQINE
jgi:hypothetical protein